MITPTETGFDLAFGRLTALRCGAVGQPRVLALHGWLDNAASFLPLAARLPALDLVMLDLPGHGRSGHEIGRAAWRERVLRLV